MAKMKALGTTKQCLGFLGHYGQKPDYSKELLKICSSIKKKINKNLGDIELVSSIAAGSTKL